ncbi:hypothetical protein [Jiella sp. M17.18]|uniref:hypothetical protein n=1 Tax=Jiella sp. M17.18 TaxID=3234247 RepID=UPI0034DE1965
MNEMAHQVVIPADVGSYTVAEAARLLGTPPLNIRRWLGGYTYRRDGELRKVPPLWSSQLSMIEEHLELGFRDLIELRFVKAFVDAGVGLLAVRNCLNFARACLADERPFSTQRFKTDGRTIFLQSTEGSEDPKLLDLRRRQYVFHTVFEKSFKDLDIEEGAVARWRPYDSKASILIDPRRSFGRPIAAESGIPTAVLARAVTSEESVERVAQLFEVKPATVRDAMKFEERLQAA